MASTIVWLRDDLRLDDNPALAAAASLPDPMNVVYILDEVSPGIRPLGGAAKWWLHHSLSALSADLEARGSRLLLRRGGAATVIRELVEQTGAGAVHWNRRYGLPERTLDAGIKEWATAEGIDATSYQANLLFEPWTVRKGTGGPYRVFTPFWRSCLAGAEPRPPA
ncbi:deoxyribodipyrimidine photo-lyase [Arthrobacter sp. ISL-5]|uniref:deoxyribodipyrimidine photo-lyase n=1 Tax=Arthrobacter sp. ISL-5 TaxID=2819111 RepID=UPI0035A827E3